MTGMFRTLAIAALLAGPATGIASAQTGQPMDAVRVQQLISTWPAPARDKALKMIKRNGMPDEVTDTALVWDTGTIKRRHPKSDPTIVEGSLLPDSQVAEGGAD